MNLFNCIGIGYTVSAVLSKLNLPKIWTRASFTVMRAKREPEMKKKMNRQNNCNLQEEYKKVVFFRKDFLI